MISKNEKERQEVVGSTQELEPARDNSPVVSNPDSEMHKPDTGDPDETDSSRQNEQLSVDPVEAPKKIKIRINSDNDGLLPGGHEKVFIGCVDEVNGAGAVEVDGYVPTRHEVLQLVKYWYRRFLENRWDYFVYGGEGSTEIRVNPFARRRIARAYAAIGKEAADQAIEEAHEDTMRVIEEWLNEIFENGTREQWDEVGVEEWRGAYKQYCADDLKEMEELETKYPSDLIALVLHDRQAGERRTVLGFSTADSELVPLLEGCPQIEVLTTKSRIRRVTANRTLRYRGFIRARRQGGDWLFDFPRSTQGTVARSFHESVVDKIKKALGEAVDEQEDDDLSSEI